MSYVVLPPRRSYSMGQFQKEGGELSTLPPVTDQDSDAGVAEEMCPGQRGVMVLDDDGEVQTAACMLSCPEGFIDDGYNCWSLDAHQKTHQPQSSGERYDYERKVARQKAAKTLAWGAGAVALLALLV